jgi:glycosyltransferase involved in cell wall biosynthesis
MANSPLSAVSVIIPTYNRARTVCRAIASALAQTHRPAEITVVDDGSTDRTSQSVAPFSSAIQYLRHADNRGVSAARNTGIKASTSPLVAFLDSDDYWLPNKLSAQVGFLAVHPEAVACQTQEIWIRRGVRVNPKAKHRKPSGDVFEPSLKRCLVSPSAVMLKRSLLDEVGLFDEAFPVCEDYDLWLRVSCRYPIHLIDEALVVKQGGTPDQLSRSRSGLDRYRIQAILKVLTSSLLTREQALAALEELSVKCRIYGQGCLKRGRKDEGDYYLSLPGAMRTALLGESSSLFSRVTKATQRP